MWSSDGAVDDDVLVEVLVLRLEPAEAMMLPPTSPMAVARRPSVPGPLSRRTRRVTEYAAVGGDIADDGSRPPVAVPNLIAWVPDL